MEKKIIGSILRFVVFYMWVTVSMGIWRHSVTQRDVLLRNFLRYITFIRGFFMEPRDSPYRMEDVFNQIPETLTGADLEAVGYPRGCYQKFTKNQDRLRGSVTLSEIISKTRSLRNSSSSSASWLFPPECIFCEKLQLKLCGKTEWCIKFPMFKDEYGALKKPTWKKN